jgi:branched-chain amino acid transport system substrate-binding protein
VTAGCGSNDKKSSTASASATTAGTTPADTTASAPAAKAPTGAPIKLGAVSSCGGALASGLGGACPTIKAWAKSVNAAGGINGHPVQMTVIDDAGVPEKSLAGLKTLVEQDKVMAIVGEYSVADPAWPAYIKQSGVPVVGGASTEPPFVTSPDFFPSGAQVPAYEYAEAVIAKKEGKTKLGMMYCAEAPTCATNEPLTRAMIKNGLLPGQQLVFTAKISATQPSFTAVCLAAKAKGVDALLVAQAGAIAVRVVDQCAAQGYKPLIMSGGGVLNQFIAKNPNMDGAFVTNTNPGLSDTENPAGKRLKAALARYAPSLTPSNPQWNASIPSVWSGGLLFEAAAKAGNLGPTSTPADVKKALYSLKDETLGGFSSPLNFKEGEISQVPCAYIESVANKQLTTSKYGSKPICIPGGDTTPYLKLLQ